MTITTIPVSMIAIQTIAMTVGSFICSASAANVTVISNSQMILMIKTIKQYQNNLVTYIQLLRRKIEIEIEIKKVVL
jgi:hypothetical protein